MAIVYDKDFFRMMLRADLEKWIKDNYDNLIGSTIFTKNNSLTSKIVSWAQKIHDKSKDNFIPSHTASIVEKDGELYLFDMKPPKASIQPLFKYLYTSKDEFVLVLRNYPLDTFMFSRNLLYHVGELYPYLSAIRSVFTKRQTKWVNHCSEIYARELDRQGFKFPKGFNLECTPNELLNVLKDI